MNTIVACNGMVLSA